MNIAKFSAKNFFLDDYGGHFEKWPLALLFLVASSLNVFFLEKQPLEKSVLGSC